jgi:ABC-2 type transport system ATP-binding protein
MKLRIRQLSVSKHQQPILSNFSYSFEYGYIHAIVGNNGAGKTILLNALAGEEPIETDRIFTDSQEIKTENIAYAQQRSFQYNHMTGNDYLHFLGYGNNFDIENINNQLKLPLDKPTDTYSQGMIRKLHLLGVLASNKPILVFDDPFASIDDKTKIFLKLKLRELISEERVILVAVQEEKEAATFADYIHHLENGHFKTSYPGRNDMEKQVAVMVDR